MDSLDKDTFGHLLTFIPAREILLSFVLSSKYLNEKAATYKEKIQYFNLCNNPDIMQYLKDTIIIFKNTEITVKNFKIKRYTFYGNYMNLSFAIQDKIIELFDDDAQISTLFWHYKKFIDLNWRVVALDGCFYGPSKLYTKARVLCIFGCMYYKYANEEHEAIIIEYTRTASFNNVLLKINAPYVRLVKIFEAWTSDERWECPSVEQNLRILRKWPNARIEYYTGNGAATVY